MNVLINIQESISCDELGKIALKYVLAELFLCVKLRKGLCELSGIREKWMELWNKIMKCQMDNMCKETSCKEKIGMVLVY